MFYLDLFAALDSHKVDYLLIGGLALNIYGVEGATMDIDLMIALDDTNSPPLHRRRREFRDDTRRSGAASGTGR